MNNENKDEQRNCKKKPADSYMLEGMIAGMLLGLLFGDSLFGINAGMPIGLVLGAGMGLCFNKRSAK